MYYWFLTYLSKQIKFARNHLKWAKEQEEQARYLFLSNPNIETHYNLQTCKERTELFIFILKKDKKDIEYLIQ